MKKRIIIFLAIGLLTYSQKIQHESEINVRELVQQQIEEAKKRESETKLILSIEPNTTINKNVRAEPQLPIEDTTTEKLGILILFSISIFSILAIRRRLSKNNIHVNLKKNIKLMREEKFIKPIDPKLKKIRTSLCLTSTNLNASERDLTDTAKKYNIAKSELLLAAKFNRQTARLNY